MPALANARHERFAQELAKGKSQSEAYQIAGYEPSEPNASRLTRNDKVQARVAELQERGAIKAEVTAASLIEEAEDVRSKALAAGQFSAAIAAIREKGVLAGVRVEKRESTHKTDPKAMTDDELALIASAGSAGVVAPPTRKGVTH
jgi:phage terminase small subunit